MEDYRDSESYIKMSLIYPKEDNTPPCLIVCIDEMYRGTDMVLYQFRSGDKIIGQCYKENLYKTMQLLKKLYNEDGKAVLFA